MTLICLNLNPWSIVPNLEKPKERFLEKKTFLDGQTIEQPSFHGAFRWSEDSFISRKLKWLIPSEYYFWHDNTVTIAMQNLK